MTLSSRRPVLGRCWPLGAVLLVLLTLPRVAAAQMPPIPFDPPPPPPVAAQPRPAAGPGPVARPPVSADDDHARKLVREGNTLFEVGKYGEALALYERAYRERQNPKWLFNMAQAHRELKNYAEAIRFYELFIAKVSDYPDRNEILALVTELRQKLEQLQAQQRLLPAQPAVVGTRAEPAAPAWYGRWYIWTLVGLAVAGAVVGGVVGSRNPNPAIPGTDHGNMAFFGAR